MRPSTTTARRKPAKPQDRKLHGFAGFIKTARMKPAKPQDRKFHSFAGFITTARMKPAKPPGPKNDGVPETCKTTY